MCSNKNCQCCGNSLSKAQSATNQTVIVPVPGTPGATPDIGLNGNWVIDGEDTGKPSRGEENFLVVNTIEELRSISEEDKTRLENGLYKGVQLNGYESEGDTPLAIQYFVSTTVENDNGGNIIQTNNNIKLEHSFVGKVDSTYFGVKSNDPLSNVVNYLSYCSQNKLEASFSENVSLSGIGSTLVLDDISISTDNGASIEGLDIQLNTGVRLTSDSFEGRIDNESSGLSILANTPMSINGSSYSKSINIQSTKIPEVKITGTFTRSVFLNDVNVVKDVDNDIVFRMFSNDSTIKYFSAINCNFYLQDLVTPGNNSASLGFSKTGEFRKFDYVFFKDCRLENIAIQDLENAVIENCKFIIGNNHKNNQEMLHLGSNCTVRQCIFSNPNNISGHSDIIDVYNSNNIHVEGCQFLNYNLQSNEAVFTLKSHYGDPATGIDSDIIGPQYNVTVRDCYFLPNTSNTNQRCFNVWNNARGSLAGQVIRRYNRAGILLDNNTLVVKGGASGFIGIGNPDTLIAKNNKIFYSEGGSGTFMSFPFGDFMFGYNIVIDNNIMTRLDSVSASTVSLFTSSSSTTQVPVIENLMITNNIVDADGYLMNTTQTNVTINTLYLKGNRSQRMFNNGNFTSLVMSNTYVVDDNIISSKDYMIGTTGDRPSRGYIGRNNLFRDVTINKFVSYTTAGTWVDMLGTVS